MRRTLVGVGLIIILLSAALTSQEIPPTASASQASGVRFGVVATAAAVRGFGAYAGRDTFTPGSRVWLYAEALGAVRGGRVDIAFHFVVTASDGNRVFETTAEFSEASSSVHWGAWRSFELSPRAPMGAYTLTVDVVNRLTGEKGVKAGSFTVVSAATALPPVMRSAEPDADDPGAVEPLSPQMEEAFALLERRQFEQAIRSFRKALDKEKTSARGWWGLARAYDGLNAYKNVLESCDRVLECTQAPRFLAIAHNLKGVALFRRASDRKPPVTSDLAEADREFHAALAADGSFHAARFNAGMTLLKGGFDEAGIAELRAYLAAAPNGSSAKEAERMIENPRRAREEFAPEFSLVTVEGEHIDLDSLKGKVVVIDFWASWCQPCRDSIPVLKNTRKRFPAERVVMVSVSLDSDAAAWRSAMDREKMSWHQCLDGSGRLARAFGVRPIPTTIVLDGEGVIRRRIVGYSTSFGGTLRDAIEQALKAGEQ